MESKIAIIGIFVSDNEAAHEINKILHSYNQYIISRMGIPYKEKNIGVITIIIDAQKDIISALSGKLGKIKNVSCKTMLPKEIKNS